MLNFTQPEVDTDVDVRESMRRLPDLCQPFLTWLSGKPLNGQKPLFMRNNLSHIFTAYSCIFFGVYLGIIGLLYMKTIWGFALPLGWLLIVSGARKLTITINHYCVHGNFFPSTWKHLLKFQYFIAEINSVICFVQCFEDYKREHMAHHKLDNVATISDPDMVFMKYLGFLPGMSKKDLWKNFYKTLVNPWFHFIFLKARIKSNFLGGSLYRKIATRLYLFLLIVISIFISWQIVLFVWIFPLTILYHISALMQFSSEHRWLKGTDEDGIVVNLSLKEKIARSKTLTAGRFFGECVPKTLNCGFFKKSFLWTKWLLRMFFIHLPMRLYVLPGDLPQHDWHHRAKKGDDWANAAYARQTLIENMNKFDEPYIEVWGINNAINAVFCSLSQLPPLCLDKHEERLESEVILGM